MPAFVLFAIFLTNVPCVPNSNRLWLMAGSAVMLSATIAVGLWKPTTSRAPVAEFPWGPMTLIFVSVELIQCCVVIFNVVLGNVKVYC